MTKTPKQAKNQKKIILPQWEEEDNDKLDTGHSPLIDSKLKQEAEAKLFRETIATDNFNSRDVAQKKSNQQNPSSSTNANRTKITNTRHDIDLHGMTVAAAQRYVVQAIHKILDDAQGATVEIRVITGKGNHSQGKKPQLISEIHHVVDAKFKHRLISIEVSPHELNLGGVYLKGHFDLKIR